MKKRHYFFLIVVGVLALAGWWRKYQLNQDMAWLCILTGPHDKDTAKLETDRGMMARLCLRNGWTGVYFEVKPAHTGGP